MDAAKEIRKLKDIQIYYINLCKLGRKPYGKELKELDKKISQLQIKIEGRKLVPLLERVTRKVPENLSMKKTLKTLFGRKNYGRRGT